MEEADVRERRRPCQTPSKPSHSPPLHKGKGGGGQSPSDSARQILSKGAVVRDGPLHSTPLHKHGRCLGQ